LQAVTILGLSIVVKIFPDMPFAIGVQSHSEALEPIMPNWQKLFGAIEIHVAMQVRQRRLERPLTVH
jgi:hypothetical protein